MKYFNSSTDAPVSIGDTIVSETEISTFFGPVKASFRVNVTKDNIDSLVDEGILYTKKEEKADLPFTFDYVVEHYCKRIGWDPVKFIDLFADISSVNLAPFFTILLKETAVLLDKQYEGSIAEVENPFVISLENGCIMQYHKIENIKYVSLFRSAEDAELALTILEPIHRKMYPSLYGE